jgi:predicted ATPase
MQPALGPITTIPFPEDSIRAWALLVRSIFGGMRFLDLVPAQMRKPAFPGQTVLGDSGENLSTVLQEICQAPERKAILIDWIQELAPMDIVDFEFPHDPSGLVHLLLKERSGIAVSAYSASDGTLRFLALLAALLGTHPAKLYFFEEIETGIHPSRLRLLLDLIEHQTSNNGVQVIATTHSPDLLQMINDSTFNHTSVVYRPRDTDHAIIRPVAELPNAAQLRAEQGLGPLHASGWMEDVLYFNGSDDQAAAK